MKKYLTVIVFSVFMAATNVHGQTKVEKFCEVITAPKNGFTSKRVSYLSVGLLPDLFNFKDSMVIASLQKVNSLTTDADVLNYMASLGWSFAGIIALPNLGEKLYFKKAFDKSELLAE